MTYLSLGRQKRSIWKIWTPHCSDWKTTDSRVRWSKCDFLQSSAEYLGHVIDCEGLHKAPSEVKAILPRAPQLLWKVYQKPIFSAQTTSWAARTKSGNGQISARTPSPRPKLPCWVWWSDTFSPTLSLQLACDGSPYGVRAVVSHIMPLVRSAASHHPLATIFGPHTGIPPLAASWMQRWALLLSGHTYDIKYQKSEFYANVDGFCRQPLPVKHDQQWTADIFYLRAVEDTLVTSAQVKWHTHNDPVLSKLLDAVISGRWGDLPELKPYVTRRNELCTDRMPSMGKQSDDSPSATEAATEAATRRPLWYSLHEGNCQKLLLVA